MSLIRTMMMASALTILGASIGWAQGVSQTGTGGGADTTAKAANTTAVGQTKPPSRAASPTSSESPERRTREEQSQDKIDTGICIGCNAK